MGNFGDFLLAGRVLNYIFIRAEFCVGGFGDFPEGCDLPVNETLKIDTQSFFN